MSKPKKRRRGHGEGSIYQRADGRWCASVDLGWKGGKRRRKAIYGKTRKEIADRLHELQQAKREGRVIVDDGTTLHEFLTKWLRHARSQVRETTHDNYRVLVHRHVLDELGDVHLSRLTTQHVQALLDRKAGARKEDGTPMLSPRSVEKIRDVLRIAFNWGVDIGVLPHNVAASAKPPKVERSERPALSPDQLRSLLAHIPDSSAGALTVIAAATGARRGELRAIRWGEVDLDGARLTITGSLQRVRLTGEEQPDEKNGNQHKPRRTGRKRLNPKTKRSRRVVHLPEIAVAEFRRQRLRQTEERLKAGPIWSGTDLDDPNCYVFTSGTGEPMSESSLYAALHKMFEDAGIDRPKRMGFHAFRHAWASLQGAAGTPIRVAMDQGGWSTVSTFIEIYGHAFDEDRQRAAAATDRILSAEGA